MRSEVAARDFSAWRTTARALLAEEVPPESVLWVAPGSTGSLFDAGPRAPSTGSPAKVPRRFVLLAEQAVLHRDATTHDVLYRLLWRLTHGEHELLDDTMDGDVRTLNLRVGEVKRDLHEMHAFVRFRRVETDDGEHYIAWYAPDHHIVERAASFFRERFHGMHWTILTPEQSVTWDGHALAWGPGVPRHAAPEADELEELWRTYYVSIFNPARVNPRVMRQHMPARFWPQLPETAEIADLVANARPRVEHMVDPGAAIAARIAALEQVTLASLRETARGCTACDLCGPATQTVFGEGPADAALVLVGEQPGDEEDRRGRPFVGPAGHVLDAALAASGIDRARIYVTNAVKHFRFLPRGKKRIHQRPTADQVRACRPWLGAELATLAPRVVVCLGATAAQSLIGSRFRISEQRGQPIATRWAEHLIATHHPAAILRVDETDRPRYEAELRADLALAVKMLAGA